MILSHVLAADDLRVLVSTAKRNKSAPGLALDEFQVTLLLLSLSTLLRLDPPSWLVMVYKFNGGADSWSLLFTRIYLMIVRPSGDLFFIMNS